MKKRITAAILCAAMLVSLSACDKKPAEQTKEPATPPSITSLANFDNFEEVLKGDYEVTDKAVTNYFNGVLCSVNAGLVEVKDRTEVKAGDIVRVNYTGYLDDKAFEGGSTNGTPVYIDVTNNCAFDTSTGSAGSTYIDKFSEGLIGATVDVEVAHKVTFPTNYSQTTLAGKETTFKFTVDKIYVKATPETVDDAYIAKHLSNDGHTTVDALKKFAKEELVISMVMGYIIDKSKVEIGEDYLNERLKKYEDFLVSTGTAKDIATLVSQTYGMELSQVEVYWLQYIKAQVVAEVVFAEVVKVNNLELDEKELDEFVQDVLKQNSSFKTAENVYNAVGYGDEEIGKNYIMCEFAVKGLIQERYNASQAVTE